jgi:pimeloyl-ACP methyl ester carboxylesterase
MSRRWRLFALGWVLILAGAFLAHAIQTAGGVTVAEVRFPAERGVVMSGLLYTPPSATVARPAPAVLVSHGYINTREMQSPFAIELSRRGFVVLAMDMTGHGYSTGNVGADGFGGPAALSYLRSLPMVDKANIGLEGHSLGGAPVLAAALAQPDAYKAMVLEGSTPGLFGQPGQGTRIFPRNLAVVFGQFDEFASMWQEARGSDVPQSRRLRDMFGASFPIAPGEVYGDPAAGTGRVLYNPPVTHPWEHFSRAGIGHAVDWFQKTLSGAASPRDPNDQIWLWKELGTLTAFVGLVVLMLGTFQLALATPVFASMAKPATPVIERRGSGWWLSFVLTAGVPALSFYLFMKLGLVFFPMKLFPQWITNQLLVWALLNALITLVLSFALRRPKPNFAFHGLKSVAIAVVTVGVGYLSLVLVDQVFKVDYRFWVVGLKPLDGPHATWFAAYLIPWLVFFLIVLRALAAGLAVKDDSPVKAYAASALAMSAGFMVMLGAQYASLFSTGLLLTPTEPLNTIVAIQFVPLLAIVGLIAAFTYRRTNSYVPGAVICALFITWYIVGGTATHWSPDFKLPIPSVPRAR